MDPKIIAFGVAVVAASVGGSVIVQEKPQVVAASAKAVDIAAAQVASVSADEIKTCTRERVGTKDGVVLKWACGGGVMPEATQVELDKLATPDAVSITFTPREEDGKTVLDARVQEGVLPNLDPVPDAKEAGLEAGAGEIDKP